MKLLKNIVLLAGFILGISNTINAQDPCIGENGKLEWLLWMDIPSSSLLTLHHLHAYPQSPDIFKELDSLATPLNYTDYYGAIVRGYIKAPETGDYIFNITGDDNSRFYLSTDTDRANLQLTAEVPFWSSVSEHDKYPEQTSALVPLVKDEYYYFEAHYKEGVGGDFVKVHWKIPSESGLNYWKAVQKQHLYKALCEPICPLAGIPCNDGDATTSNDIEDGFCNCYGTPAGLSACVGERAEMLAFYYDSIPGNKVSDLYAASEYPLAPDRSEYIDRFWYGPDSEIDKDSFGTRIEVYFIVPTTGDYLFNLTSNNEGSLKFSATGDPANTTEICFVDGNTGDYDHETEPTQTSPLINLTAGSLYYFELTHKDNTGSDHYSVFWKTPFMTDTLWRYMDVHYLYGNDCEMACIPEGTSCDDGDPTTFDDQYDANCNCVGTPCIDPECSNALDYVPNDNCGNTDSHSNYIEDSWLSCLPTDSPNPVRGFSHWVHYDLGAPYMIDNSQVWNYNVAGATQQGFEQVVIDYSLNGINWTELGTFNWAEAPGTNMYSGFEFADLTGITARYILITSLSNFDNSNCMGISEITFTAFECPQIGSPCDDGDPNTMDDTYDSYCECSGTAMIENTCTDLTLTINDIPVPADNYDAIETIFSAGKVIAGSNVSYIAGESITLNSGFEVELGALFIADIIPCTPFTGDNSLTENDNTILWLDAFVGNSQIHLNYNLPEDDFANMWIEDIDGNVIHEIFNASVLKGTFEKTLPVELLQKGIYIVHLKTSSKTISDKLVKLENNND